MKNETNPHLKESIAEAEAVEAKARKYYKQFYAKEISNGAFSTSDSFPLDLYDVNELIEDEVALELETYERLKSKNLPLGIYEEEGYFVPLVVLRRGLSEEDRRRLREEEDAQIKIS